MRSTTLFLVAASLGLAIAGCDEQAVITSCSNDVASQTCPPVANGVVDPCGCSKVSRILSCYSVNCPGEPQVSSAAAAEYSILCLSANPFSTTADSGAMSTSVSDVSSTAAAASTGAKTVPTATATGTGVTGEASTAPATGSVSGSAASATPSKAWGQQSLVLPAGGVLAAIFGLAILL